MRARKPCVLFLFRLLGWYVLFIDRLQNYYKNSKQVEKFSTEKIASKREKRYKWSIITELLGNFYEV